MVEINKTTISPCIINSTKITRLLPNYVLHGFEMTKYKIGNKKIIVFSVFAWVNGNKIQNIFI